MFRTSDCQSWKRSSISNKRRKPRHSPRSGTAAHCTTENAEACAKWKLFAGGDKIRAGTYHETKLHPAFDDGNRQTLITFLSETTAPAQRIDYRRQQHNTTLRRAPHHLTNHTRDSLDITFKTTSSFYNLVLSEETISATWNTNPNPPPLPTSKSNRV